MGVYDTVMIPCPKCGELTDAQSKSGDCVLETYNLDEAPGNVLLNVNRHAPFICQKCGSKFAVDFRVRTTVDYAKTVLLDENDRPVIE